MAALISDARRFGEGMLVGGFEIAQGVAHLRGLFVVLGFDGFAHCFFQFLPSGKQPFGANFFKPIF